MSAAGGMTAASSGERLGVLGGTFDPVHFGHLAAAVGALQELHLDRVLMMVAAQPWQKSGRVLAPAADRLAMVQAAVAGVEGVEASGLELDRPGDTYTVDTLDALKAEDPNRQLYLVVGDDVGAELDTWHRADDVAALATLVVVSRPGEAKPEIHEPWTVERVTIRHVDISSSKVRAEWAAGRPIDHLVPAEVITIIRSRGLYSGTAMASLPGDR